MTGHGDGGYGGGFASLPSHAGEAAGEGSLGRFAREVTRHGRRYRVEFDLLRDSVVILPVTEVRLDDLVSGARTVRVTGLEGWW